MTSLQSSASCLRTCRSTPTRTKSRRGSRLLSPTFSTPRTTSTAPGNGVAACAILSRSSGKATASGVSPPRSSPTFRGAWRGSGLMAELPRAAWTRREDLARLVAALGADSVRWVGGAVRDTWLGKPVQDIDAATPLRPDAVIARLDRAGIRTIPTGIDHGTVTALLPEGKVEVTTLRRDVSTDG